VLKPNDTILKKIYIYHGMHFLNDMKVFINSLFFIINIIINNTCHCLAYCMFLDVGNML